jgi:hypothetical protein
MGPIQLHGPLLRRLYVGFLISAVDKESVYIYIYIYIIYLRLTVTLFWEH